MTKIPSQSSTRFQPTTPGGIRSTAGVLMLTMLLLLSAVNVIDAWSSMPTPNNHNPPFSSTSSSSRRTFFADLTAQVAMGTSVLTAASCPSGALDMDAFIQKELTSEVCDERTNKKCMPKLTDDQALCRFGQPSKETGEACVRAGMSTKRSSGVDAYGKVDRGEYTRCKAKYVDDGKSNNLVKEWNCQ